MHTLGTLLEDHGYKEKLKSGDLAGLLRSLVGGGNPLDITKTRKSYEAMNRDAGQVHQFIQPRLLISRTW